MAIKLIAGRAGSGKTHACLTRIIDELLAEPVAGPPLVLLVPEQAALQMERTLVNRAPRRVLGRCEVLSFRRLAHRVFGETAGPLPVVLTPNGRQMALRHLLLRHRRSLKEFGRLADRPSMIRVIAEGIVELIQESAAPEQLLEAARAAEADGDPGASRLHDAALLLAAYREYLGDGRVDPEDVLDLARRRLEKSDWLRGARICVDGFAGLTQQQLSMLVALADRAATMYVALLVDPARWDILDGEAPPDDMSLFARTEWTWRRLSAAARQAGVEIAETRRLDADVPPRFASSPTLARLEANLFSAAADRPAVSVSVAGEVHLVEAADRREEVEFAAAGILDLSRRDDDPPRYRDMAIIVRDLTPYHELISAALAARGIPFFIDRRRPTFHHPLVQFVRALLAMHGGSFSRAVVDLLKSGLSGMADDTADALENYLLAHGIVTAAQWGEAWTSPVRPPRADEPPAAAALQSLARINGARAELLDRLGEWYPATGGAREGRPTCRTRTARLWEVMERFEVRRRMAELHVTAAGAGRLDEAEEHEQIWDDLVRLIDEATDALGDERMGGSQFREVIEAGLSEFTLGLVPATLDEVLVSSIERSRHPPIRAAWLLGFSEGAFPSGSTEDAMLNDDERARLESVGVVLGQTRVRKHLDERMLAYIAVTRPSECLWIVHPLADDDGRPLATSPFLASVQTAAGGLIPVSAADWVCRATGGQSHEPAMVSSITQLAGGVSAAMRDWAEDRIGAADTADWFGLYEWALGTGGATAERVRAALAALRPAEVPKLSAAEVESLWPSPYRTSVSRLESFASCPFQHYARYGLGLNQRVKGEVSALALGGLYHLVLEQFVEGLSAAGRMLSEMSDEQIAAEVSLICRDVVPRFADATGLAESRRRHAAWRGRRDLSRSLRDQRDRVGGGPLRPAGAEVSFGDTDDDALPALQIHTPGGRQVSIRGKMDRVDLARDGDRSLGVVFDYKNSMGRNLNLAEAYHGLALQLMTYLLVLKDHGSGWAGAEVTPVGAFYLPLVGPRGKVDHPDDAASDDFDAGAALRPRGIVDFDFIDGLDPSAGSGRSRTFSVYRKKDGQAGNIDRTDAAPGGSLPRVLEHIRGRLGELADRWLDGDIAVWPAQFGGALPCKHCDHAAVCRMEHATLKPRVVPRLKRTEVFGRLEAGREGAADG